MQHFYGDRLITLINLLPGPKQEEMELKEAAMVVSNNLLTNEIVQDKYNEFKHTPLGKYIAIKEEEGSISTMHSTKGTLATLNQELSSDARKRVDMYTSTEIRNLNDLHKLIMFLPTNEFKVFLQAIAQNLQKKNSQNLLFDYS